MKFEDLQYDFSQKPPIDEKNWNRDQWVKDYPVDYFKILYFTNQANEEFIQNEVFKTIYRIIRLYIPDTLFKYYSLTENDELNTRKFETLENRKIYLSDICSFNDPFDSRAFYYDPNQLMSIERLKQVDGKLIDDFSSFIRSTSLSANGVQSMPMWAHYSNNHTGFCVSYDMNSNSKLSSCTFPVQYTNERLDITSMMCDIAQKISDAVDRNIEAGIKKTVLNDFRIIYTSILLNNIKHSSWNYENEFRCTIASNAEGAPFIAAIPKEIYIGMKCSIKHTERLMTIGKSLNIPVYKMIFEDLCPEYKLSIKRVF